MNEYLYEICVGQDEPFTDEEIMIMVANDKLHNNRKKNHRKELLHDERVNYNFYC